jgi:hypothetical protein
MANARIRAQKVERIVVEQVGIIQLDMTQEEATVLRSMLGACVIGVGKQRGLISDIWLALHAHTDTCELNLTERTNQPNRIEFTEWYHEE